MINAVGKNGRRHQCEEMETHIVVENAFGKGFEKERIAKLKREVIGSVS